MGTNENFIDAFLLFLFFLLFRLFSPFFEDGWGIDDCVQLTVLLYRDNMDAFRWWSIAGIGRMIDVTDIGIEIGEERIVRWNGMRKKIVKIRKIVHRKFFSMQMCYFIIARFFFYFKEKIKDTFVCWKRINNKYFNYLKIAWKSRNIVNILNCYWNTTYFNISLIHLFFTYLHKYNISLVASFTTLNFPIVNNCRSITHCNLEKVATKLRKL